MKKAILFTIFILIFIPTIAIAGVKDFQEGGLLQINYPQTPVFKLGEEFDLHFHLHEENGTNIDSSIAVCTIHIYNLKNKHILIQDLDEDALDFEIEVNSTTITETGIYGYNIWCISGGLTGFVSNSFEVTRTGELTDSLKPIFIILGLFAIIILFLYLAFNLDEEHWALKLFLVFFSVIIMQLIPKTVYDYSSGQVALTFIKFYAFFLNIFFTYVGIYFTYLVLEYLGYAAQIKGYLNSRMRISGFKK